MREQPTGEALLQCARDVLKNNVIHLLTGDAKRDVLMVMNAMSIAQRELQVGAQPEVEEQHSLANLLGKPILDISQANRELAIRIRAGLVDPDSAERVAILNHLRLVGWYRLQASNPKVLMDQEKP